MLKQIIGSTVAVLLFSGLISNGVLAQVALPGAKMDNKRIPRPAPMAKVTSLKVVKTRNTNFPYKYEYSFSNSGAVALSGYLKKVYAVTNAGREMLLHTVSNRGVVTPGNSSSGVEPFNLKKVPPKALKDIRNFKLDILYKGKRLASKKVRFTVPAASSGTRTNKVRPAAGAVAMGQPGASKPSPFGPKINSKVTAKNPALLLIKGELTDLDIGTESSGKWFWEATVKNSGNAVIKKSDMTVQGIQKHFSSNYPNKPASGSILPQDLAPNQSVTVKRYWTRCCVTKALQVNLRNNKTSSVVDSEELTNLMNIPGRPFGNKLKIKNISWDDTAKAWRVTIKNDTPYAIKLVVQGYRLPGGNTSVTWQPAGGFRVTVPAGSTKVTKSVNQSQMQHGDKLKVALIFDTDKGFCGDYSTEKNCGAERGNITTIPQSADFP